MEIAKLVIIIAKLWAPAECHATEPAKSGRIDVLCDGDVRGSLTEKGDVRVVLPSCRTSGKACKPQKIDPEILAIVAEALTRKVRQ